MGIRTRLIAATVAAATLTAIVGTATASAAPTSPTASAPSGDKKEGPDKDAIVAKVAASLHVSVQQLVTALDHLKLAPAGRPGLPPGRPHHAAPSAFGGIEVAHA